MRLLISIGRIGGTDHSVLLDQTIEGNKVVTLK